MDKSVFLFTKNEAMIETVSYRAATISWIEKRKTV